MTRPSPLIGGAVGLGLLMCASINRTPWLVWNVSPSVPVGLYAISTQPVRRGNTALVRLPSPIAEFADRRGYVARTMYLLKPVAAVAGDHVCRRGQYVNVGGGFAVIALRNDSEVRRLPIWKGCRTLSKNEVFLLARPRDSFDGRYFGPLSDEHVIGRLHPLWTLKQQTLSSMHR